MSNYSLLPVFSCLISSELKIKKGKMHLYVNFLIWDYIFVNLYFPVTLSDSEVIVFM